MPPSVLQRFNYAVAGLYTAGIGAFGLASSAYALCVEDSSFLGANATYKPLDSKITAAILAVLIVAMLVWKHLETRRLKRIYRGDPRNRSPLYMWQNLQHTVFWFGVRPLMGESIRTIGPPIFPASQRSVLCWFLLLFSNACGALTLCGGLGVAADAVGLAQGNPIARRVDRLARSELWNRPNFKLEGGSMHLLYSLMTYGALVLLIEARAGPYTWCLLLGIASAWCFLLSMRSERQFGLIEPEPESQSGEDGQGDLLADEIKVDAMVGESAGEKV